MMNDERERGWKRFFIRYDERGVEMRYVLLKKSRGIAMWIDRDKHELNIVCGRSLECDSIAHACQLRQRRGAYVRAIGVAKKKKRPLAAESG